ncbi:MAG TPA: hypothetical protein VNM24_04685 [Burkholderiales bacterium]|jgi:hypothetical protein|nr:hypothetical protein [Burkholderiales bacterium]
MTQTLASAFQAAIDRIARNRPAQVASPREDLLLSALHRSATGMDQIVRRRIGLIPEEEEALVP